MVNSFTNHDGIIGSQDKIKYDGMIDLQGMMK